MSNFTGGAIPGTKRYEKRKIGLGSNKSNKGNKTTNKPKKKINWEKWGKAVAKGEELAAEAKNQRTLSGMSPRASAINKSGAGTYNYRPKQMSDKPGDTSPMVRYDSDYEKQKKSMGL